MSAIAERLSFDKGTYINRLTQHILRPTQSWVYVWIDANSRQALYVGETGRSKRYDLLQRLRYSIGELKHPTLNQVHKNARLVRYNVHRPLDVHAFLLADDNKLRRQSIEAWLHWLILLNRNHHPLYFGFCYRVPQRRFLNDARVLYNHLRHELEWPPMKPL